MANQSTFTILFSGDGGPLEKTLQGLQRDMANFGRDLEKVGKDLTTRVTAPLVALGTAAVLAAETIDDAMDTIRVGTGATGQALATLEADFRAVFREVPQAAGDVSKVIGELNTRLGLTGAPLQALSTQMLNLARITGTDVREVVQTTTRVFGDWSIATAEQSSTLDFLFKTSQATGIGVSKLSQLIVQFGAPLRQFGIGFDEAAALMGKWEKEGVNTELVMGSLRIALGDMAEKGVTDFAGGLRTAIKSIQDAKTNTEATTIAFDIFGRRAGADMAAAIREGRFSIEDLLKVIKGSGETINKASKDIGGFTEMLGFLRNRLTEVLEPLGKELVTALNAHVIPALLAAGTHVKALSDWFSGLDPTVKTTVLAVGALVAALGPVLIAFGALVKVLGLALGAVTILAPALPPIGIAMLAIAAATDLAVSSWRIWKDLTTEGSDRIPLLRTRITELEASLKSLAASHGGLDKAKLFIPGEVAAIEGAIASVRKELTALGASAQTTSVFVGDLEVQLEGHSRAAVKVVASGAAMTGMSKEQATALAKLRQEYLDLARTDAEKFLAAVAEKFKDMPPHVQAAARAIAALIPPMKEALALDDLAKKLAEMDLTPTEAKVLALVKALEKMSPATKESADGIARQMVATDAMKKSVTDAEAAFRALGDGAELVKRDFGELVDVTELVHSEAVRLAIAYGKLGDATDKGGDMSVAFTAISKAEEDQLAKLAKEVHELEDGLKVTAMATGATSREAALLAASWALAKKPLAELTATQRDYVERQVDAQREGRRLAEISALLARGYTQEQAAAHVASLSAISDRQKQRVADGDYFGFLGGSFQLAALQGKTFYEGIATFANAAFQSATAFASDFLFNFITGTATAAETFKNFGKSILRTITDLLAQKAVQMFINFLFGGSGGGGGLNFSGLHTGGVVGGGGVVGNIVGGLGPNEFLKVLEQGEAVFSAETWTQLKDLVGLGEGPSAVSQAGEWLSGAGSAASGLLTNPAMATSIAAIIALGLSATGNRDAALAGQSLVAGTGAVTGVASIVAAQAAINAGTATAATVAAGGITSAAFGGIAGAVIAFPFIMDAIFGGVEKWDPLEHQGLNMLGQSLTAGRTPDTGAILANRDGWAGIARILGVTEAELERATRESVSTGGIYGGGLSTIAQWADGGASIIPVQDPLAKLLNPENIPNYNPLGGLASGFFGETQPGTFGEFIAARINQPSDAELWERQQGIWPGFRVGLDRVPGPEGAPFGPVMLHGGEGVLTAAENRRGRRRGGDLRIGPIHAGGLNLGELVIKDFRRRASAGERFLPTDVLFERSRG